MTSRTRVLILNTPHNPTGRVFDADEFADVTNVVLKHDLVLLTDEIYERILYDGRQHTFMGSLEPLRDRTITVSGLSKTFAITGWRLGYMIAPTHLSAAVRPVHDFLTVCAPTPLQVAAVSALNFPQAYYDNMLVDYHKRREIMIEINVARRPKTHAANAVAAVTQNQVSTALWKPGLKTRSCVDRSLAQPCPHCAPLRRVRRS